MKHAKWLLLLALCASVAKAAGPFIWNGTVAKNLEPNGQINPNGSVSTPSYSFISDQSTGWYRRSSGSIAFSSSGTGVFAISNSGAIGIETITPTFDLTFDGTGARTISPATVSGGVDGAGMTIKGGDAHLSGNNAGGDLTLSGGQSTGNNTSNIIFQTATAGSSGSADNSPTTKMQITGAGVVSIAGGKFSVNGTGNITKINNVTTSWPSSQGGASTFLQNDSAGNLTWGTPSFTLAIGTPISGSTPGSALFVDGSNQLGQDNANFFWDTGNKRLGIGTTAPSSSLAFSGDSTQTIKNERGTVANTSGKSLTILSGGSTINSTDKNGGDLILSSATSSGTGTSNITFKTAAAGSSGTGDNPPTTSATITGAGNVGIGTSSPTSILSLSGQAARTVQMERQTTANTAGNNLTVQAGGSTVNSTDKNGGDLLLSGATSSGTGTSNITFQTATAGSTGSADNAPSTKMSITGAGNIGIGTTSPTAIIGISGQAARNVQMERNTTANTAGNNLTVQSGGATLNSTNKTGGDLILSGGIASGTGTSNIQFQTASAGSTGSTTITPNTKLYVTGLGSTIFGGTTALDSSRGMSMSGQNIPAQTSAPTTLGASAALMGILVVTNISIGDSALYLLGGNTTSKIAGSANFGIVAGVLAVNVYFSSGAYKIDSSGNNNLALAFIGNTSAGSGGVGSL